MTRFISDLEQLGNLSGVDFKLGLKTIKDTWSSYRQEVKEILTREHMYSEVTLTEKTIQIKGSFRRKSLKTIQATRFN